MTIISSRRKSLKNFDLSLAVRSHSVLTAKKLIAINQAGTILINGTMSKLFSTSKTSVPLFLCYSKPSPLPPQSLPTRKLFSCSIFLLPSVLISLLPPLPSHSCIHPPMNISVSFPSKRGPADYLYWHAIRAAL